MTGLHVDGKEVVEGNGSSCINIHVVSVIGGPDREEVVKGRGSSCMDIFAA